NERRANEREEARQDGALQPAHPRDIDVADPIDEVADQWVGRHAREKDGRSGVSSVIRNQDEKLADQLRRRSGLGAEIRCDATSHWKDNAAAAGRIGRNERREDEIGRGQRVPETKWRARESPDKQIPDARSKAGHSDRAREKKRGEDQPHSNV